MPFSSKPVSYKLSRDRRHRDPERPKIESPTAEAASGQPPSEDLQPLHSPAQAESTPNAPRVLEQEQGDDVVN